MALPNKFRKFSENIYAGALPNSAQMQEIVKQFGIKHVLSFVNDPYLSSVLKQLNVNHIVIPFVPSPVMNDTMKYLVRNIKQILSNQPIYIHCALGQDRTGFALALYRILKDNWKPQAAVEEAKRFGYGNGVPVSVKNFWNNILLTLSVNKNPSDVGAADDKPYGFDIPYFESHIKDITFQMEQDQNIDDRIALLRDIKDGGEIPLIGVFNNMGSLQLTKI